MSHINFNVDPTHEFKAELLKIQDTFYLDIAVSALNKVPDYFWFVPASSSGKYHPKSSLGMGGLVRHVKSVFWIAEELLAHPLYAPFTDTEKDEIRVACLLHDCCKQGTEKDGSHTVTEHPLLVRDALDPFTEVLYDASTEGMARYTKDTEAWNHICDLIETHMGIWTKDKEGKEVLDVPKTNGQLFVHMCDFLASRKIIEVDVTPREAQSGYNSKSTEPTWKSEPATDGQVDYIRKLYVMASQRNITHPGIRITDENGKRVITKGIATDTINELKAKLGMQ